MEKTHETSQSEDERDAAQVNPVRKYYAEKMKRYRQALAGKTKALRAKTSTPFDLEDAAGYAQPYDKTAEKPGNTD